MKTQTLLLMMLLGLVGCEGASAPVTKPPEVKPPILKKIIAKADPIENKVSGWDTLTGDGGIRTKSKTVYYLIAEDGTHCEVDMGTWYRVQVGSQQGCEFGNWEQ